MAEGAIAYERRVRESKKLTELVEAGLMHG